MRMFSLLALIAVVLFPLATAVSEDGSGPPAGVRSGGGNPVPGGLSDSESPPERPLADRDDNSDKERAGSRNLDAIRDASLRRSAGFLQIDLEQLYSDSIAESPSGDAGGDEMGVAAARTSSDDRMRKVLRKLLSIDNNKSILTLVSRGAPRVDLIGAALNLLRGVTTAESASLEARTIAAEEFKFVADPGNHIAFEEALIQEHAVLMAKEDLNKLEARQKIEMELARARHLEKLQSLERERLERELGRL